MEKVYREISIENIAPDPAQPRQWFDAAKLQELAESIRQDGVLQPIEVSEVGDGRYLIHHGERRWRASKMAGLSHIPAIVAPPQEHLARLIRGTVENLQRADLPPIDEARVYLRLKRSGMPVVEICSRMGVSDPRVKSRLMWVESDIEEEILDLVNQGRLPKDKRVCTAFMSVPDSEIRVKLAQALAKKGTSIHGIESACGHAVSRLKKKELVGDAVSSNQVPSLRLAVNGKGPAPETKVSGTAVRAAAKKMCQGCFYMDDTGLEEPAWALVSQVAEQMCRECVAWEPGDSLLVCQECPGAMMVKHLVSQMRAEA